MAQFRYYKLKYRKKNNDGKWEEWQKTEPMRTWGIFNLEVLSHDAEYELKIKRYYPAKRKRWNKTWSPSIYIRTPKRFLTDAYLG